MSGTDPSTPYPTESGVPGPRPPAPPVSVPPTRSPAPVVHVGGAGQAAPDDAPTSLMPAVTAPAPPQATAHDLADATRIAVPLPQPAAHGDVDATQYLPPVAAQSAPTGSAPTRTPSYSAGRAPATPPAGPYGGLYAGPLAAPAETVPDLAAHQDAQRTQFAGQAPVPPPPTAAQPAAAPIVAPAFATAPRASDPVPAPASGSPRTTPRAPARTAAPRARGRVEPRVAVLGGVVGALVVVAVVLGLTLFGGSDAPAVTPSAGASSSAGAGAQPVVTERFAAPSRNISCTMTATEARCSIAQLGAKPAPVDGCDGTVGYVAKLGADGTVETPCVASKDQPRAASSKLQTLAYGKSVRLGKLTCSSSETGIECRAKGTGKGFSIARAGVRVL